MSRWIEVSVFYEFFGDKIVVKHYFGMVIKHQITFDDLACYPVMCYFIYFRYAIELIAENAVGRR